MDAHIQLLSRLAQPRGGRVVLLVLDGLGDLRGPAQERTALEIAATPQLDALARRSTLGRIVPVVRGVTPGSGPAHLALFGYDPAHPRTDIGRGVLEALGLGLELDRRDVAARGNFATADADGNLTDRRAGRIATAEGRRVAARLAAAAAEQDDLEVRIEPGEAYRFVLLLQGEDLSAAIADTDPQRLGVPPLAVAATADSGRETAARLGRLVAAFERAIADEPKANRILLRGFSKLPKLPAFPDLYRLRAGAFAGYPLYRGVAAACGMEVVPASKDFSKLVDQVTDRWQDFDYFFLHVKQTDQAGEDGDVEAKARVIEEVDRHLPRLLELEPEALAITGDHSTPAPMKAHSWHPVPLLLSSPRALADGSTAFDELAAARGGLGTFPSRELLGLLLAHAGRLAKYGA